MAGKVGVWEYTTTAQPGEILRLRMTRPGQIDRPVRATRIWYRADGSQSPSGEGDVFESTSELVVLKWVDDENESLTQAGWTLIRRIGFAARSAVGARNVQSTPVSSPVVVLTSTRLADLVPWMAAATGKPVDAVVF